MDNGSQASGTETINHVHGWRVALLWLLSLVYKLLFFTVRFRISDEERTVLGISSVPHLFVIWHNRIIISPALIHKFRCGRKIHAMVSVSRDGALISRFVEMLGLGVCRGSSSKRAMAVMRDLLNLLKAGEDVAITPDGPRGPIYSFHDGASVLALLSRAPVILACPNPHAGKRFNSWDGFYLPHPFSKVTIRVRRILPEELPQDREECSRFLRAAMTELTVDLPAPPRCRREEPVRESA
ncbi:MAG: lysophospholipid acyltransferase family protein [Opitutales bacterium]|jgi:hypothetical protein